MFSKVGLIAVGTGAVIAGVYAAIKWKRSKEIHLGTDKEDSYGESFIVSEETVPEQPHNIVAPLVMGETESLTIADSVSPVVDTIPTVTEVQVFEKEDEPAIGEIESVTIDDSVIEVQVIEKEEKPTLSLVMEIGVQGNDTVSPTVCPAKSEIHHTIAEVLSSELEQVVHVLDDRNVRLVPALNLVGYKLFVNEDTIPEPIIILVASPVIEEKSETTESVCPVVELAPTDGQPRKKKKSSRSTLARNRQRKLDFINEKKKTSSVQNQEKTNPAENIQISNNNPNWQARDNRRWMSYEERRGYNQYYPYNSWINNFDF